MLLVCCSLAGLSGCNLTSSGNCIQGKRWFEVGDLNRAVTSFQQAQRANPQNPDPYYNLGAIYHRLAATAAANASTANLSGGIGPAGQPANANNAQSVSNQYLSAAENYYRQAIALDDRHVDAHRALAVLLIQSNRQAHGFELIRTWQARHPESAEPLVELARLHQEYGDQSRAVQFLADAINIDGNHARAHKALGVIREQQGQYHLALDNFIRSYQANNLQSDLPGRIANLQSRLQLASVPQFQAPNRQGSLAQPGTANQYVPR